ncbi:IS200/IS605 family element transposase accessory protein TnpB [Candidatus Poribacteria bacterium]|nr:IS200/IS605 family element transposase accessory protein TnpB [Candidatus Poribacteria bacterium]MYH82893.1 IS200/IS605 family element transposase accessory protein TnpB [Candidatus Poribacteria bacterium]MYK95058.1 IS200/IS605 family element transposase accessory protein TnpB [Candidatus Poribacteria bacterium]
MSKSQKDYLTYIIATAKPTEQLDRINRLGGQIYSQTLSLAFKTHRRKGFWLSDGGLKAYLKFKGYPCHSHSVQAIVDDYCGARRSYFANAKTNPNAKPPHKTRKFHTFTWRATGISYKHGNLRLSMGKDNEPLWITIDKKFHKKVPAEVSLVYHRTTKQYEFHATYIMQPKKTKTKSGSAIAVDMGEIHPIATFDGLTSEIYNGRLIRSVMQYRNKFLASINKALSRCVKYSKRYKKLKRVKQRTLQKIDAQIRDMRHKITSRFVSSCRERRIETIVIGDIKHIRRSIEYGKKANQKLHQWAFSKIRDMITYKAKAVGINVDTQDEAYTSQTCPSCRNRKKPSRRTYHCSKCKWQGHRDVVGASNILTKYQGWLFNPVVGAVVSPRGVRYEPHLRRLDKWSPFSGLKSSKPPTRKQRSTRL